MNDVTAEMIEVNVEEAKRVIALSDAFLRLRKNRDFQLLIEEEYFKNEPARLVGLKASPPMQNEKAQAGIDREITAIGGLQQFFNMLGHAAENAERLIDDANEQLAAMAEEGEL